MSGRLPTLRVRDLVRVLHKLGFVNTRHSGSHFFFIHPDGRTTTVAKHGGKDISRGLLRKIINDIELTLEDFMDSL